MAPPDYDALLAENAWLRAELAALRVTLAELVAAMAKSNDRIAELVAAVDRKKAASRKSTPAPEAPPDLAPAARAVFDDRPAAPSPPEPPERDDGPRASPTGRKPLPAHLPRDRSTVVPTACPCGCDRFDWVDEVVEEKLDIRAHQRVRRTTRKTGRCQRCGHRSTGEAPPAPFERSKVTCEWLAWAVAEHIEMLVPLDRLRRSLTAQGLPVAISFLVSQIEAASTLLETIDGEHWKQLLAGDWMGSDGTGLKVQIPKLGLHHGFIEVYHRDELVVFQYEAEKGGTTQADKLVKFTGGLLVDAESRYNETFRTHPAIVEFNCNAHPRRKLRDAEAVQPVLAAEAGRFVSAMFLAEAEAKTAGLKGDTLLAWRRRRIRPLATTFRRWIDAVKPTLVPSDALGKVLQYYLNHWDALFRFIDHPSVPIDNSASEREFQPVAKRRLNSLFAGSTEGAHRAAVLLGIAATCRRAGVSFREYLAWVFVRRGTHRDKYHLTAAALTPAAYKRTLAPST